MGLLCSSKNFNTDLSLFSKSPLYLVPAINAPMSREYNLDSCKNSGVSLELIKCAKPSAIAVLPTPDSPTSNGLFLVRLARIWIILSTSSMRPTN